MSIVKMRQSTAFLVVLGALMLAQGAWAFHDARQDEGKRIVDDLIERWAWETFWDGSTSGFRYQPRADSRVEVFWNADLVGMCSRELGSCAAYERSGAGLAQFPFSERLGAAELRQATDAFLRRLNELRVIPEASNAGSRRQSDIGARHFERGGAVVSIPTPGSEAVVQRNASNFQTCAANRSFPSLGLPKPIRDKIKPEDLGAFQQWLESRLHPPAGTKSEYVIPYYASNDPMVYVLLRVNGTTESVIFAVPDPSGTGWRLGGHFDPRESPAQIQRLEPLIRSARMTSVSR